MVPYDRLSPGFWYIKKDDSFDIVQIVDGPDKLIVYCVGDDFPWSLKTFIFLGPVADPYLGKWDNVS